VRWPTPLEFLIVFHVTQHAVLEDFGPEPDLWNGDASSPTIAFATLPTPD
jgi:hypothetical protein